MAQSGTVHSSLTLRPSARACAKRKWCACAEAFEAAELDATFQIEQWGEDPEATRRRAAVRADLEAAQRLMALVRR